MRTICSHLVCVCFEPKDFEIIREHIKDLETYRHSHPNIEELIQMLSSCLTRRESGYFNAPMFRPMTEQKHLFKLGYNHNMVISLKCVYTFNEYVYESMLHNNKT